jgi:PAS domain S-box-containing protein
MPTEPQDSSDLYRRLVESVSDYAIFALDVKGYVSSWNPGAQHIKGYAADEIIGRHFSSFYPPEDVASGKPAWELEVAAREGRIEDEGWRVRKDGTRFWANVVISAVRNSQGEVTGFSKVTRDLTVRRKAEEALRHSEERFRLLVQSVKDYAILMLDAEGHVASWNIGAQHIKGYTADEILGRSFTLFYPPEAVAQGFPQRELEMAAREGRFEDEGWRVRKDGSRFWANVVISALRNSDGRLVGFAKVTRDLTARRDAEAQARRLAAEQAAHAEAERRSVELAELNRRAQEQAVELETQAEELRVLAETLHNKNDELRAALADARTARESAERAAGARDEVMAIVVHDLRNPMNTILTSATIIGDSLEKWAKKGVAISNPELSADLKTCVEAIQSSVKTMDRLICDLLDVARMEAGSFSIQQAHVDVGALLEETLKMFESQARAKKIIVTTDVPTGLPPVHGDRDRLEQVLSNLLGNAFKFTPEGGRVMVQAHKLGASVQIMVEDSGPGIPAADLPRIFDRYWRGDRASRDGAGLGLAICKGIVDAHGGNISVESTVGRGTTFRFTVPCAAE